MTVREDAHARIESETRDGKSACRWDFYPDHATLTLLRIDLPTFWFLYEGTPGGKLDAERDFVIRPDGQKTTLDQPWSQVSPGSASVRLRPPSASCASTTKSPSRTSLIPTSRGRSRRIGRFVSRNDRLRLRP